MELQKTQSSSPASTGAAGKAGGKGK